MSMFIMIYTIYEALIFNTEDILHIISLAFAISMILFYIILIAIILLLIFSSYKIDESSHNKLEEFFIGLKSFKKTRIHIVAMIIRRGVYVSCLVALVSNPKDIMLKVISRFYFIKYFLILY